MRQPRSLIAVALTALLVPALPGLSAKAGQSEGQNRPFSFVMRAAPAWIEPLNAMLAAWALPQEVNVPAGIDAEDWLRRMCGGRSPAIHSRVPMDPGGVRVSFAPCMRVRLDVPIRVTPGDTAEALIRSVGLPGSEAQFVQFRASSQTDSREVTATTMRPGDSVIVREMPVWTSVTTNPLRVQSRGQFRDQVARIANCPPGDAASCLARRGVFLLDGETVVRPDLDGAIGPGAGFSTAAVAGRGVAGVGGGVQAKPALTVGVHPEQWPYDAELVVQILVAGEAHFRPATVGVADGGLRDRRGGPLPLSQFYRGREPDPEPDRIDDDWNLYEDDIIGGGPARLPVEALDSGDIGLCPDETPIKMWSAGDRRTGSHGAVVAALATGMKLRRLNANVPLPLLSFYRLLVNACEPQHGFRAPPGAAAKAVEFLRERGDIVTLAYTLDQSASQLRSHLELQLEHDDWLLVVPAGNFTPGNLDGSGICPACLGDPTVVNQRAAQRVLVVGAATADLRRAPYSNYGPLSVGVFAPGEPSGVIDLGGEPMNPLDGATSFAAPYVSFAAGILKSFGLQRIADIRDRIITSTWPLTDVESEPDRTHVGVLDLAKVAAVRHHAVEVIELGPGGVPVRRTYVGRLEEKLEDLGLCPATRVFSPAAVHAIRIGPADVSGERLVQAHRRVTRKWDAVRCRPTGTLSLVTLSGVKHTFQVQDVTYLHVPW